MQRRGGMAIATERDAVSKACHGGLDPPSPEKSTLTIRGLRISASLRPQWQEAFKTASFGEIGILITSFSPYFQTKPFSRIELHPNNPNLITLLKLITEKIHNS